MKTIYLDNNATTRVAPEVLTEMTPYFSEFYGNPSSMHSFGGQVAKKIAESRAKVAALIGADPDEIIFTSCGTESDNTAIHSALAVNPEKRHIITSRVEHPAVKALCEHLAEKDCRVTTIEVDSAGNLDMDQYKKSLSADTAVVSLMWANNETGVIFPVEEAAQLARERGILFHTDAVQAGGSLDLDVNALNVDLMSLSAHKFYGPKGIGILYARRGIPFLPMQTGGGHERGRRAGTENVAYIVGIATALRLAYEEQQESNTRIARLRDKLIAGVLERIPDSRLTGHPAQRLPNSASFLFKYIEGESTLLRLDLLGVAASSGSACTSGSLEPSHVLTAMGFRHEEAHGSLRLTLGKENSEADVDYVLGILPGIVEKLRRMSPLFDG